MMTTFLVVGAFFVWGIMMFGAGWAAGDEHGFKKAKEYYLTHYVKKTAASTSKTAKPRPTQQKSKAVDKT